MNIIFESLTLAPSRTPISVRTAQGPGDSESEEIQFKLLGPGPGPSSSSTRHHRDAHWQQYSSESPPCCALNR